VSADEVSASGLDRDHFLPLAIDGAIHMPMPPRPSTALTSYRTPSDWPGASAPPRRLGAGNMSSRPSRPARWSRGHRRDPPRGSPKTPSCRAGSFNSRRTDSASVPISSAPTLGNLRPHSRRPAARRVGTHQRLHRTHDLWVITPDKRKRDDEANRASVEQRLAKSLYHASSASSDERKEASNGAPVR
jgi:hypothetical protein